MNFQEHQEGNNYEAVKAQRITVNLFDENFSSAIYGRYYFNEYPQLKGKTIVGVKANLNPDIGEPTDFNLNLIATENTAGKLLYYVDTAIATSLFINFYNDKNELVYQNMPVCRLANTMDNIFALHEGNIMPINSKMNIKNSYVFTTEQINPATLLTLSLTFYYLE